MKMRKRFAELSNVVVLVVAMARCLPSDPPTPKVTGVMPSVAPNDATTELTLTGDNFQSVTNVSLWSTTRIGQACAPITVLSPNQLRCTLPPTPQACGGQSITVSNAKGAGDTLDAAHGLRLTTKTVGFTADAPSKLNADGVGFAALFLTDFDGDKKPDLILVGRASAGAGNLYVLLGDGAGGLTLSANVALDFFPWDGIATIGDFNGDQHPDVAVLDGKSNAIHLFLGNGTGTISASVTSYFECQAQASCGSLAAADFNGDQRADLAITQNDRVTVMLSGGTGGFDASASFLVGTQPSAITVGDFNGDGKMDIVTANFKNTLSVLLGDGMGGFAPAISSGALVGLYAPAHPESVVVGDFNQDNNLDVLTTSYFEIGVLLGDGTGRLRLVFSLPVPEGGTVATVGDMNNDQKPDLIWNASSYGGRSSLSHSINVSLGNGMGGFAGPQFLGPGGPKRTAVSDLDGDGRADLVLESGSFEVWLQCH